MSKLRTLLVTLLACFRDRNSRSAAKLGWLKAVCIACVVWAATAVSLRAQNFATLDTFVGSGGGAWPYAGLIQATDGNLYGTTTAGGSAACTFGCGTVFRITAAGALTVLYSFDAPDYGPSSGLIQATDGNFYGTTAWGGGSTNCYEYNGCGTVYEITAEGALTTLYSFTESAGPLSGVIQARDGNFYGTTYYGGPSSNCYLGCGTIFSLTAVGTLTTLYSFSGTDGVGPGVLIQARDGNLYGTTLDGGAYNGGTVFKLSAAGTLTTLHSFCSQTNCGDGQLPATLIQGTDGNLYGTTLAGGANGYGTIFKLTVPGTLTTAYSFCAQKFCSDGNEPTGLMQASDGNLYGTTNQGGRSINGGGTIFEIIAGKLTTIHTFVATGGSYASGETPQGGVMQAPDGTFYGTAAYGGACSMWSNGCGTIFTFGPATGTLSKSSLNFAKQALDESSGPMSLTLTNSGGTLLTVSKVAVTGDFSISASTCAGAELTSGQLCRVSVTFTPQALGLQSGTLSFTDNAVNNPQIVELSGTGIEPSTLTPASHAFPETKVGETSVAHKFTLMNHLNAPLTGISYSTTGPFAVSTTTCGTTLASKKSCTISVTFSPTATGTANGTLTVNDDASDSPQTSSLTGTGD